MRARLWRFLLFGLAITLLVIALLPLVREVLHDGLNLLHLDTAADYVDSA